MKTLLQRLISYTAILSVLPVPPIFAAGKKWAGDCGDGCVETALGNFNATDGSFVQTLLNFGFGMAGGIAFLLILWGGLQIVLSGGNPEKLNEGKEIVTSAIVGLLFVLFSVFLLQFIGVSVLKLPGFS